MVVVAVAGGTGGVGKTVVEQLRVSPHQVVVLGRGKPAHADGVTYVQVSYDDEHVADLTRTLEEHGVETVISAIGIYDEKTSNAQLNLIRAASQSTVTQRFIPSEYSYVQVAEILHLDPNVQRWIDAADLLKSTSLKFTRFVNGFFMDYWGMPHVQTNLAPFSWAIDLVNKNAAIPGDGSAIISLTLASDLAKFMVKSLDLDEWPEFSIVVGEDISFNNFLALAEKVRDSKFEVKYDSEEELQSGNATVLPLPGPSEAMTDEMMKEYLVLFGNLYNKGIFHMPMENRLSDKIPDLKPVRLEEFLRRSWEGR